MDQGVKVRETTLDVYTWIRRSMLTRFSAEKFITIALATWIRFYSLIRTFNYVFKFLMEFFIWFYLHSSYPKHLSILAWTNNSRPTKKYMHSPTLRSNQLLNFFFAYASKMVGSRSGFFWYVNSSNWLKRIKLESDIINFF